MATSLQMLESLWKSLGQQRSVPNLEAKLRQHKRMSETSKNPKDAMEFQKMQNLLAKPEIQARLLTQEARLREEGESMNEEPMSYATANRCIDYLIRDKLVKPRHKVKLLSEVCDLIQRDSNLNPLERFNIDTLQKVLVDLECKGLIDTNDRIKKLKQVLLASFASTIN